MVDWSLLCAVSPNFFFVVPSSLFYSPIAVNFYVRCTVQTLSCCHHAASVNSSGLSEQCRVSHTVRARSSKINVVGTCVSQSAPRHSHFRRWIVELPSLRESCGVCLRWQCDTLHWWRALLSLWGGCERRSWCWIISVLRGPDSSERSKDKDGMGDWGNSETRLLSVNEGDVKLILINVEKRGKVEQGPVPPALY